MENTTERNKNYPKHIAIMVDGNRRWAKERGLPTLEGHRQGAEALEKVVFAAKDYGVKCITAWGFSTENWTRSKEEVTYLFDLFGKIIEKYTERCLKEKVRFVHIGRKDRISPNLMKAIENLEEATKTFTEYTLVLALDYGGHDELTRTMSKIKEKGLEITSENIENNLDTASLPPVDLIIRTGNEHRLSGFLSWQSAYAELYFAKVPFPDFTPEELKKALDDYSQRERRFGGDSKTKK